jgi:hypothetical protein
MKEHLSSERVRYLTCQKCGRSLKIRKDGTFPNHRDLCARYQGEDTELHREIQRLQADHAVALRREEEKGYARGLRDAKAEETAARTERLAERWS